MNAENRQLRARRPHHWAGSVRPIPGPDGLLWLITDDRRLLGLDPDSGERRVEQPSEPGADDRYELFSGCWPNVVRRRDAPPRPTVTIASGCVITTVDGRETGRATLPSSLPGQSAHARLAEGVAWILHHPTRGETRMRVASFDLESQTFGLLHELDFSTLALATVDRRIALFDEARGRVHVLDPERAVGVVQHVPSECWGSVALAGDEVAVVSHQRGARPGAAVAVGWTELRGEEAPALRRFALHTQGATSVTFVEGALAIHQYTDVTLITQSALRAAPTGELVLAIEDVATAPPPQLGVVPRGPDAPPKPDAPCCTAVRYGALLADPDGDDEPIEDEDALRALDGTLERSGDLLDHLLDEELDVESDLVALRPMLRFGGEPSRLHLALEFYTRQLPTDADLACFEATAERLLDGSWGLNYEFDPPAAYHGCRVALDYARLGASVRDLDEH